MADGVRIRNLDAVLRLVHRGGSLSRATITDTTGLNRSTVSDLIAELARRGLVRETDPVSTNRAGRPSPTVEPHPDVVALAVNPEIDAITVAWVGLGGRVLRRERRETGRIPTADDVVRIVPSALRTAGRLRVAGVGVAVPGIVREEDGVVRWAPHLEWTDVPLGARLVEATGLRVAIGNDATLGAVAEHLFGAGRGIADLVYLNGGASGIGGGILSGGTLVGGRSGYAGEFGQTRPVYASPDDAVTGGGTLEEEVSRGRILTLLNRKALADDALTAAIDSDRNPALIAELDRQTRVLAANIGAIATALNPRAVVLGGYLATLRERDPDGVRRAVAASALRWSVEELELLSAGLGDDRLLVGAAEPVFAELVASPR